jgi:hypothetical protein
MYSGDPPKRQTSIHKLLFLIKKYRKKERGKKQNGKKAKA